MVIASRAGKRISTTSFLNYFYLSELSRTLMANKGERKKYEEQTTNDKQIFIRHHNYFG